jgi:hypothetical protein
MKRLALSLLILGSLTFAPAALATSTPSGFVGRWTAIDCPSEGGAPADCSIPWRYDDLGNPIYGDASALILRVSQGLAPAVTYEDTYASSCDNNDSPSTRWIAAGTGEYDDPFLWANFTKSGCGAFAMGGYSIQLYYDPGSDTIWEDTDGDNLGTIWTRAN